MEKTRNSFEIRCLRQEFDRALEDVGKCLQRTSLRERVERGQLVANGLDDEQLVTLRLAVAGDKLETHRDVLHNCFATAFHDGSIKRDQQLIQKLCHVVFGVDDRV